MILGVGTDIVSINRLKKVLNGFEGRILNRLFTPVEQAKALSRKCEAGQLATYATRYAAKEAFSKAIGTGIGSFSWVDIEVDNDASGAPFIRLNGAARALLDSRTPSGYQAHIFLSMSDEVLFATAVVVIELNAL